jgi:hypothetical protein
MCTNGECDSQTSLWEALLPEHAKRLPAGLAWPAPLAIA